MDDLGEKLAGILNDPESMEKVRIMAENILGGEDNTSPPAKDSSLITTVSGSGDADTVKKIMNIINLIKSRGNDSRSALLLALRPHLSEPRQEKLDTAVKILRIIDLLPLIKDSGLLNL